MKIFCALIFTLSCVQVFATTADWARAELKKSQEILSSQREKIAEERKTLSNELNEALKELKSAELKLKAQRERENQAESLLNKSKFMDLVAEEMYADLQTMVSRFSIDKSFSASRMSLAEISEVLTRVLPNAQDYVLNPLAKRPCSALLFSNTPIKGEYFRVGAFRFFVSDDCSGFLSSKDVVYGLKYGDKIRAFSESKSDILPVDLSNGALLEKEKGSRSVVDEIRLGGIWILPILFFGALSAVVLLFKLKLFFIRRVKSNVVALIMKALARGDEDAAMKIAKSMGYPYSNMLGGLISSRNLKSAMLEEVSYEYMLGAGEKIFSWLSVLSVSAAVTPLFGLLGTVTGIIKTFGDLSFQGAAQAQSISAGISEALITTEYGLIVAIPAFVAHALLSRRAKAVMADMEKLASAFVSGISEREDG